MLETAHTAFLWTWLYQMIVTNFGSILFLNAVPWSLGACLITFCVVGELVEAFFTYRVYINAQVNAQYSQAWHLQGEVGW
jgi:hypothetical protein